MGKFDKYFSIEVLQEIEKRPGAFVTSTRHLGEKFGGGHLTIDAIYITSPHPMINQPHKHEFPQYLNFFGANPYDPREFDAEIEMTLGEDETHGEKHIITRPTSLYIPAGIYHGPLNFKVVNKPVLFIDIAVSGKYSRVGNTPD